MTLDIVIRGIVALLLQLDRLRCRFTADLGLRGSIEENDIAAACMLVGICRWRWRRQAGAMAG